MPGLYLRVSFPASLQYIICYGAGVCPPAPEFSMRHAGRIESSTVTMPLSNEFASFGRLICQCRHNRPFARSFSSVIALEASFANRLVTGRCLSLSLYNLDANFCHALV